MADHRRHRAGRAGKGKRRLATPSPSSDSGRLPRHEPKRRLNSDCRGAADNLGTSTPLITNPGTEPRRELFPPRDLARRGEVARRGQEGDNWQQRFDGLLERPGQRRAQSEAHRTSDSPPHVQNSLTSLPLRMSDSNTERDLRRQITDLQSLHENDDLAITLATSLMDNLRAQILDLKTVVQAREANLFARDARVQELTGQLWTMGSSLPDAAAQLALDHQAQRHLLVMQGLQTELQQKTEQIASLETAHTEAQAELQQKTEEIASLETAHAEAVEKVVTKMTSQSRGDLKQRDKVHAREMKEQADLAASQLEVRLQARETAHARAMEKAGVAANKLEAELKARGTAHKHAIKEQADVAAKKLKSELVKRDKLCSKSVSTQAKAANARLVVLQAEIKTVQEKLRSAEEEGARETQRAAGFAELAEEQAALIESLVATSKA